MKTASLLALAGSALIQACAHANPAASSPLPVETPAMSMPPSASRPPAPQVQPLVHEGVRYQEDQTDERNGDQAGGYLVAVDAASGTRLWRLRVYALPDTRASGLSQPGLHFRALRLADGGKALEVENESGGIYRVDLASRNVTHVGGPAMSSEQPFPPPKPKPKP